MFDDSKRNIRLTTRPEMEVRQQIFCRDQRAQQTMGYDQLNKNNVFKNKCKQNIIYKVHIIVKTFWINIINVKGALQ